MVIFLQFIAISHLIVPILCLSPVVPPRFDNFCEQIVGTWSIPIDTQTRSLGEVEEVMRSCGGAVQGIRELPEDSKIPSAGAYHNRADDGFVYFGCGSYTQGPTQIETGDGGSVADICILGSISFETIPKTRVTFDSSSRSWQPLVRTPQHKILPDLENESQNSQCFQQGTEYPSTCMKINWGKDIICCKQSSNQPWMLQRVKWEQSIVDECYVIDTKSEIDPNELKINSWIRLWKAHDNDLGDEWGAEVLDKFLLNDISQIVQLGAACVISGEVKALLRCYDEKGMLKAVSLQQGKLDGDKILIE